MHLARAFPGCGPWLTVHGLAWQDFDPKKLQIRFTSFLEKNTTLFMKVNLFTNLGMKGAGGERGGRPRRRGGAGMGRSIHDLPHQQ